MTAKIDWYREILNLDPASKVFFPLARLLSRQGKDTEAITILEQGLTRHPEFFEARLLLVELLHKNSMTERYKAELQFIIPVFSSFPGFWQALAEQLADDPQQADAAVLVKFLAAHFISGPISLREVLNRGLEQSIQRLSAPASAAALEYKEDNAPSDPQAPVETFAAHKEEMLEDLDSILEENHADTAGYVPEPANDAAGQSDAPQALLSQIDTPPADENLTESLPKTSKEVNSNDFISPDLAETGIELEAETREPEESDEAEILSSVENQPLAATAAPDLTDAFYAETVYAPQPAENEEQKTVESEHSDIGFEAENSPEDSSQITSEDSASIQKAYEAPEPTENITPDLDNMAEDNLTVAGEIKNLEENGEDSPTDESDMEPAAPETASLMQEAVAAETGPAEVSDEGTLQQDSPDKADEIVAEETAAIPENRGKNLSDEAIDAAAAQAEADLLADMDLPDMAASPEPAAETSEPVNELEEPEEEDPLVDEYGEEEQVSLRTRSMAEVLAEQGDINGALEIYQELAEAATSADELNDINQRISTLKSRITMTGASAGFKAGDAEAQARSKEKLIGMLEALARRVEARAQN